MFCPNCGTKIVPGAKFCENCGQRVDFAAAEGEAEQSAENAAADTAAASDSVTDTTGTSTAGTSETASDSAAGSDSSTQNASAGDSAADAESDASRIQREAEEAAARAREAAAKAAEEARRASEDTAKYAKEKAEQAGREANRAADSTARAARETAEEAARQGEALKQQWTPGNMERLAAFAPFSAFAAVVIPWVLFFLGAFIAIVIGKILPFRGFAQQLAWLIFVPLNNISKLLFCVLALAGVVASVQLYGKKEKQTTGMAVCLGANVLALILTFFILISTGNVYMFIPGIALSIVLAFFALDALSRVFLRGTGIASEIQPSEDFAAFKSFAENPREKTEQFAAEMKREGTSGKAVSEEILDPNKSVFDGSGMELFLINLVGALICLVTIGLASPWVICYRIGWDRRHTVYNGRRLAFNGTGIQLFGKWIIWFLLTIVTCGLYSFVMGLKLEQWILSHTTFADEVSDPNNTDVFPNSGFEGNMFEWIGYNLVMGLASGLTCGIALPWVVCSFNKWYAPNVRISGKRLRFEGSGAELFGQYIIVLLLSIVTCGLYYSWGYVRLRRWAISHLSLEEMN